MSLITPYARKEPAQERAQFLKLTDVSNWFDTCLYKDSECKALEARIPHDHEGTPQEGAKVVMINWNNYALEWVPAITPPRVVVFDGWDDRDVYDYTQTDGRGGDILVMPDTQNDGTAQGRRIGVLYSAWPIILVGDSEELHSVYDAHGKDRSAQAALASDWLAQEGGDDPRARAAAYLLNALMKPDADLDTLLQGVEKIQASEVDATLAPRLAT